MPETATKRFTCYMCWTNLTSKHQCSEYTNMRVSNHYRQTLLSLSVLVVILLFLFAGIPQASASNEFDANIAIDPRQDPVALHEAIRLLEQSKAIGLMRHALAPGVSDPQRFSLDDCATQRNLSDEGRQQAKSLGQILRENGLSSGDIRSSQWCRCVETAELLMLGPVKTENMLNSVFQRMENREAQTQALTTWMQERMTQPTESQATILVSHQANISALLGGSASSGELLIVGLVADELSVLMRLLIPH